jgi:hypothetical protein
MRSGWRGIRWLGVLAGVCVGGCGGGGGGAPTPPPVANATFRAGPQPRVFAGHRPVALLVADFDEDGVPDLAVGNHLGDTVSILAGDGDGTFTPRDLLDLPTNSGVFDLATADVNGDTHLDLVTANSFLSLVSVFLGVGDGTFTAAPGVSFPLMGAVHGVALAEVTGDLHVDLIATGAVGNRVTICAGNGAGAFGQVGDVPLALGARRVVVGRIDGDALLDLAIASFDGSALNVLLGQGNGFFVHAPGSPIAVGARPWDPKLVDLDDDGDLDVATPADQGGVVGILLGNGNGTFAAAASPAVGAMPIGSAVGDVNGDAIPDLAVASFTGASVAILLGNGSGGFVPGPTPTIAVGGAPFAMALADLDLDGVLDLVVANEDDDDVSVLLGNAD